MFFRNREEAGKKLVKKLSEYKNNPDGVVLGLPRGGVVTAFEVAQGLHLPLDIIVARKIGAPENPEFALGAITENGKGIFHQDIIETYHIPSEYILDEILKQKEEARRRILFYRRNQPSVDIKNKIVLLIDDGVATGATILAAIASVKIQKPRKIVVAVPVIAPDSLRKILQEVDEIIALEIPNFFMAVGQFYEQFPQTTDQEVVSLMQKARQQFIT